MGIIASHRLSVLWRASLTTYFFQIRVFLTKIFRLIENCEIGSVLPRRASFAFLLLINLDSQKRENLQALTSKFGDEERHNIENMMFRSA